jgi:hypothetical protein
MVPAMKKKREKKPKLETKTCVDFPSPGGLLRLRNEPTGYAVRRVTKNLSGEHKGLEREIRPGYYATLEGALVGVMRRRVHDEEAKSIRGLLDALEAVRKEILGRYKP